MMRNAMKRTLAALSLVVIAILTVFCSKGKDMPTEFDIVGQWGVTTVTHVNPNSPSTFFEEYPGKYYSYWTFQVTGIMIEKAEPSGNTRYATYVYDVNKKKLTYLYEGYQRSIEARVIIHDPVTITVNEDLKEVGSTIYTMKKLAW